MYGSTSGTTNGGSSDYSIGFAGAGGTGPGPSNTRTHFDTTLFNSLCDNITSSIFAIGKHATTLEKTLKTIGSVNDSKTVRESVHVLQVTANNTISKATQELKGLQTMIQGHHQQFPEEKMRVVRLTSDFQTTLQRYTDLQKQIVAKMKTTLLRVESHTPSVNEQTEDQQANLLDAEAQKQAQLQLQQELEFEQGLLLEREAKIREIESDILDVNAIMKEIGVMVREQGEAVDSIEGNIEGAYTQVDTGRQELEKAESYQRTYRKRLFCLLILGAVILTIIVIILIVELKH